jgi:hypothetical protein
MYEYPAPIKLFGKELNTSGGVVKYPEISKRNTSNGT